MSAEFDAALAKTEYANAIASLNRAVVNGDKMRVERDRALATIERVRALAETWAYKGEFGWGPWQEGYGPDQEGHILDYAAGEVRKALSPTQGEAQQAASATNGRKGPELRPCDSVPATGLTGGTP